MDELELPEPNDTPPEPQRPVHGDPAGPPPFADAGNEGPGDFLELGAELEQAAPPPAVASELGSPPLGVHPLPEEDIEPAPLAADGGELAESVEFDPEDDEGSWLMSLDDVIGDRAGTDTIVPTPAAEPGLPLNPEASWSEGPGPKSRVRRALVPLTAVVLVSVVGWAGWRFVDLRGELTTQGPGALDPGSAPQPRRVVPLDGPREGAGPATRQSIGKGPGPRAGGRRGPGSATAEPSGPGSVEPTRKEPGPGAGGTRVAYEPSSPPSPTLAPGVPFVRAPELPSVPSNEGLAPPEPVAVARASDADPAPIPETLPTPSAASEPAPAPRANTVASVEADRSSSVPADTRRRWRSLFGLGSSERSTRPRPLANPDERIIASSTESGPSRTGDGVQVASALPYGLDSAYIDGWSPPLEAFDGEIEPSELPIEYVRAAGWRDLIGIWVGSEVPFAAIDKPERTLTPAIGFVAVYMKSGEIVEGVLTEVGGGRVWIQTTATGRLGLRHESFESIDVLGLDGTAGQMVVESLSRVRVATAGGAVYGRLVTTDDERATVYTDAGARITVPRKQIELLGSDAAVRLNRG